MSSQRTNKFLVILVVVLLLSNALLLYYLIRDYREEKKDRSEKHVEWVTKELKLDDNQLKQYIALRAKRDSIMRPMNESLRQAKMNMIGLLGQPANALTDSLLSTAADNITAAQKPIEIAYYDHFRRMQTICRPEQLPLFDSVLVRMVERTSGHSRTHNMKKQ